MTIQKLHYENMGGLLIRRDGQLHWRCPDCKEEGASDTVMAVCPHCGSKSSPKRQPSHHYRIYFGHTVPFNHEEFTTWADACTFMKRQLDAGVPIHSVHKEERE